jgi:hypothetical protein
MAVEIQEMEVTSLALRGRVPFRTQLWSEVGTRKWYSFPAMHENMSRGRRLRHLLLLDKRASRTIGAENGNAIKMTTLWLM